MIVLMLPSEYIGKASAIISRRIHCRTNRRVTRTLVSMNLQENVKAMGTEICKKENQSVNSEVKAQ